MLHGALTVAQKEFRHMRHDRITVTLTFLLPMLQLLLYGYILDTQVRNAPAVVINRDSHRAGRLLAARISQSPLFAIRSGYTSEAEIESGMRAGVLRVGIEIPEDYSSRLMYGQKAALRVWVEGADVPTSNYLLAAIETFAAGVNSDLKAQAEDASHADPPDTAHGETTTEALRFAPAGPPDSKPASGSVDVQAKVLFNPKGLTSAFFMPGLLAVLVQTITTLLLVLSITSERERGTLEQMLITDLRPDSIIAGKCLAIGCVGFAETLVLTALIRGLFGMPIQGSVVLVAAILPLFVLAPLGLGLIVAALAKTQSQALQFTPWIFLPSVMLSGFVFPREFMKFPTAWLGNLLPTTYLVSLSRNVLLRGASFSEAAPEIWISAAFATLLLVIGWFGMRRSLHSRPA